METWVSEPDPLTSSLKLGKQTSMLRGLDEKTTDLKYIHNKLKLSVTCKVLVTNSKILDSNAGSMDTNLSNLWETGEDRGA